MNLKIIIQEITQTEITQLDKFLYEAIFIPEGQKKVDRAIIKSPLLSRYIKDFGQEDDDICFVAKIHGKLIGAIWTRCFNETEPGFGYVDLKTPELSMSVLPEYQQKGIGTELLKTMISKLKICNYKQVSLSVDKQNYAIKWYEKFKFAPYNSSEKSVIMVKSL